MFPLISRFCQITWSQYIPLHQLHHNVKRSQHTCLSPNEDHYGVHDNIAQKKATRSCNKSFIFHHKWPKHYNCKKNMLKLPRRQNCQYLLLDKHWVIKLSVWHTITELDMSVGAVTWVTKNAAHSTKTQDSWHSCRKTYVASIKTPNTNKLIDATYHQSHEFCWEK